MVTLSSLEIIDNGNSQFELRMHLKLLYDSDCSEEVLQVKSGVVM